ncbi:MAG: hypothetical protein JRD71_10985 [Deltaproteobacteria bacterium]|nr:hypothetical protein [Deltaproteobacteria bacterium]
MIQDSDFKTATMARVYSSQGHYEKAVEIYKYLLECEPDRQDLARALAGVEKKLQKKAEGNNEDLAVLFRTWIDLVLRYKRIRYLRTVKGKLEE